MAAPLGFKDFTTGEVLTAADVDGYLMQGIWVFANATARDAAVTSPQEGNSCYLKDTDVIQVYSGSSWVVKSGGSSPLTTKGDLYTYSTTDARLPVGANGTTLVADSAEATGLKWATPSSGSMTQLATGTLSGSGVNITGISGAYTHLYIVIYNAYNTSSAIEIALRFNNNGTGIYPFLSQRYTTTTANNGSNTASYLGSESLQYASGSTNNSIDVITVHNYSSTAMTKAFQWIRSYFNTQRNTTHLVGAFNTTTAIDQVNILDFSGNNFSGGTYIIYGVK